eukprot:CAMPEP_0171076076 /NCGR_PEP_ID=MMETSP0766_2-20121228/13180_1 /TAXON_ID=439317 /ORGANISM="Gambierdiscus australes, Strain CAWD 149" /LENGTH=702 /DNA_ID=CAMNT_0011533005 /DNA_START=84 /DNA_END=2192 /DNA_ORIENTATION=+
MSGGSQDGVAEVCQVAMEEWSGLVQGLKDAGVHVVTFQGQGLPDEVFPNNWFSTHSDGKLVLYPMKVPSRAQETREDIVSEVRSSFGLSRSIYDLSSWRDSGVALEGTGSLVLDRPSRIAYVAISGRADRNLAELWAKEMGYTLVAFRSADRHGEEIYHTNVLMSVGQNFAVLCTEAIPDGEELNAVLGSLKASGKVVIRVSMEQMESFACNCIQLKSDSGTVLAISAAGWESLQETQRSVIDSCVDRVVVASVPTIERLGGGSVRCMIAELFGAVPELQPPSKRPLCHVESEFGRLELVIVHEPGLEVDAVMPWTLDMMKVDECFNRVDLKAQHRVFSNLLRSRGAQVVHVRDLLNEISQQGEDLKRELFTSVWGEGFVKSHGLRHVNVDHLVSGYAKRPLEFEVPPLMNLFFMRDPLFSVPGGWVVIARPFYPIRQMESKLMKAIFRLHPGLRGVRVFEGLSEDPEVHIEGGDVLVADAETVLVGISQRTNECGAERLAEFLFRETPVTRVVKVFIPKQRAFMHLDTLFTFVDKGTVLTMPYFWSKPEVYAEIARRANSLNIKMGSDQFQDAEEWITEPPRIEMLVKGVAKPKKYKHAMSGLQAEGIVEKALFVCGPEGSWPSEEEHAARALTEQWNDAANVFCISPGTVVAYKWCTRTVSHLQDSGVDVVELDGVELMKGRGGARCMTFPLRRNLSLES